MSNRLIAVIEQGVDEEIPYAIDTTNWGSNPGSVAVKAYDVTDDGYEDVTSTVLSGAVDVDGNVITLPILKSLTDLHVYRVEIKFTADGIVFEPFFVVEAYK